MAQNLISVNLRNFEKIEKRVGKYSLMARGLDLQAIQDCTNVTLAACLHWSNSHCIPPANQPFDFDRNSSFFVNFKTKLDFSFAARDKTSSIDMIRIILFDIC